MNVNTRGDERLMREATMRCDTSDHNPVRPIVVNVVCQRYSIRNAVRDRTQATLC